MNPPSFAAPGGVRADRLSGLLARVCIAAWAGLLPLVMWLGCADTVETPKRLVLAALASLLSASVIVDPGARTRLAVHPLFAPLACLLAATVAVSGFGAGWTGEEGSWAGGASLAAGFAGALGAAAFGGTRPARIAALSVVVAAAVSLGYMAAQAAGLDPVPWDPGKRTAYWLMATLGNPVHLAAFLTCAFFATFALWEHGGPAAWPLRILFIAGALATRQRSVWLGLAGGFAAVWWITRPARRGRPSPGGISLRADAMLSAAVAATAAATPAGWRLFDVFRAGSRPWIWDAGARLWTAHPFFGIGPDLFHARFPGAASHSFFAADPPTITGANVFLRLPASVHNEPLGMAVAGGALLLGAYAWALAAAVRAGSSSRLLPAAAALWGVHLVNPSSAATGPLFWLLLVLAAPCRRPVDDRRGSGGIALAVGGLVLAASMAAVVSATRTVVAQAHRREAGRLAFTGGGEALFAHMRSWDAWTVRLRPGGALADAALWRARWEGNRADDEALSRAQSLLAAARRADPGNLFAVTAQADLDLQVGRARPDRDALLRAESGLRAAIGLAPAVASLHGDLAEVLDALGRRTAAAAARAERVRLDPRGVFGTVHPK